ncbi:hypothetical protein ACIQXA_24520 [Streptomyces massasporeus]|uniref:hypothetical protein n=1 Tax=Streptomyces massasporeus TaxID=67324 RepID=UPI00381C707F
MGRKDVLVPAAVWEVIAAEIKGATSMVSVWHDPPRGVGVKLVGTAPGAVLGVGAALAGEHLR